MYVYEHTHIVAHCVISHRCGHQHHKFLYLLQDRKDLANILLLQGELQGRNHYLKQANLFAHDVQEDSLMHDREHFLEEILEDGMDL